jgi:glycosyltransferase involved in cell wall biosynthesis
VRVALIGPVPPDLGGATPGGVATHQAHLAAGLAASDICAPLLATNTRVPATAWLAPETDAPFPLYRMARPRWTRYSYLARVGLDRVIRYARRLALDRAEGSRREILANLLWYRRFLAEVQPDIVHVQHPLERCLYARMVLRLEQWRMPLVVTAHSLFGEHAPETIQTLMAPNLRAADRVIAVSPHIAEQAVGLGVEQGRVRTIRSGVDTGRYAPRDRRAARAALQLSDDARLVLFVGNLEPRKQVDVLLRALATVRERVAGAQLSVVGSGDNAGAQDQTAQLLRLTRELQLEDCVHYTGRVDDTRLLDYYAAADVFALSSSSEAQGIVALEAMACGLPVVASAVGGLLGTIEDGHTGFLVPSGEVAPLADRLVQLLNDPALRTSIGSAARKVVEREFSWQRTIEDTLAVYQEVVTPR